MGFTVDTRVLTTRGSRRVGDLLGKPFSVVVDGVVFVSGKKGFYGAGRKPVWEVSLENGLCMSTTTGDTRLMTFDGWKYIDELRAGHDSVLLASTADFEWDGKGTEDDGYVAGFLWANRSPYGFSVLVSNDTDADNFGPIRRIKEFYYNKRKRHKDFVLTGHDFCYRRHTIASRLFREIAKEYNLFDEEGNAHLCEDGSHAFTLGMLKGVFDAVGIILHNVGGDNTTTLRLWNEDVRELRTAQRLLIMATGITPRIEETELIIEGDEDLRVFQEKIGFLNNEKNRLLMSLRPKNVTRKKYRYSRVVSARRRGEEKETHVCSTDQHCFYADGVLTHV